MTLREQLFYLLREHSLPEQLVENLEAIVNQALQAHPHGSGSWQGDVYGEDDEETLAGVTLTPEGPPSEYTLPETAGVAAMLAQHSHDDLADFPTTQGQVPLPVQSYLSAQPNDVATLPPLEVSEAEYNRRYQDAGLLGMGGMGEVRRVFDRRLHRYVAMKLLKPDQLERSEARSRFMEEAQVTAQLQHPGIVPVHEYGIRHDRRPFFTMKEIHGRTLRELIIAVHEVSTESGWETTQDGWNLRRLLGVFKQVCEAVGYAHSQGCVHRDLKPSNIIVGGHGEVLVVDWGLVKRLELPDSEDGEDTRLSIGSSARRLHQTAPGQIIGTPGYMPPEQLTQPEEADERSDVYALGTILYEILAGRPAYIGYASQEIIFQMLSGPPQAPGQATQQMAAIPEAWAEPQEPGPPESTRLIPSKLMEICAQAMARNPNERYPNAAHLAQEIGAWLDGLEQRRLALKKVNRAKVLQAESEDLLAQARQREAEAAALASRIDRWAPEEQKLALWEKEEAAENLKQQATLMSQLAVLALQEALYQEPELEEAHLALAAHYQKLHAQAELQKDKTTAQFQEHLLAFHLEALPPGHLAHRELSEYLEGYGRLSLRTDPPGAMAQLYRLEQRHGRLIEALERELGVTPLTQEPVLQGNYILKLEKTGYKPVLYPLEVRRLAHLDGYPPGVEQAPPIHLPVVGSIAPNDCLVPQGWAYLGESDANQLTLPESRLWVDAFVIQRYPVTHREYLSFLNELVAIGLEEKALRYAPQERPRPDGRPGELLYDRDPQGLFCLRADRPQYPWQLDNPVVMIDWVGAMAYATWMQKKTGLPWRLPWELEWEKAARGVDGRLYPWGDKFEPTWCNTRDSRPPGQAALASIKQYHVDQSPYGVRGMAGNVSDWCLDTPSTFSHAIYHERFVPPRESRQGPHKRVFRGGSWTQVPLAARLTMRHLSPPETRLPGLGFRLVRPHH